MQHPDLRKFRVHLHLLLRKRIPRTDNRRRAGFRLRVHPMQRSFRHQPSPQALSIGGSVPSATVTDMPSWTRRLWQQPIPRVLLRLQTHLPVDLPETTPSPHSGVFSRDPTFAISTSDIRRAASQA